MIAKARSAGRTILQGPDVFKLYDTYGFPMDLIAEACREQGLTVDEAGFDAAIEEQRNRARKTGGFEQETARPAIAELAARLGATKFVGYDRLESNSILQAILKDDRLVKEAQEGDEVEVILDVTPFYAEGGGQVGDQGVLVGPEGRLEIKETTRPVPTMIVHKGRVSQGHIRDGEQLHLSVNRTTRQDSARNHTATHLVHALPTREYVPLLITGPKLAQGVNLGVRPTAADLAQTVVEGLKGESLTIGDSFLDVLRPG